MDLLQIALVLLIVILGVFLSIMGIQVFFILRDLKKALDRFSGEVSVKEVRESRAVSSPKTSIPTRRLFRRK